MRKLNDSANIELQPLSQSFFDLEFFNKYKIEDTTKRYQSWHCFDGLGKYIGADLKMPGQLEIWKNRKKLKTIKFAEIINSNTLFPLLNVCYSSMRSISEDNQLLVAGLQIKGLIAKYEFECEHFDIDKLELSAVEIQLENYNFLLLYKLVYDGVELISRNADTVQVGSVFSLMN